MHTEENYSNPAQTNSELNSHSGTNTGSIDTVALVLVLNKTEGGLGCCTGAAPPNMFLEEQRTWIGLRQTSHAVYTLTSTDRKGPHTGWWTTRLRHLSIHLFAITVHTTDDSILRQTDEFIQMRQRVKLFYSRTFRETCVVHSDHSGCLFVLTVWLRNHPAREQRGQTRFGTNGKESQVRKGEARGVTHVGSLVWVRWDLW